MIDKKPIAVIFAFCLFATSIHAETTEEKRTFCTNSGRIAVATNQARDAGVSKESVLTMINSTVPLPDEQVFVRALASLVYAMEGIDDDTAKNVAVQMCEKNMGLR